MKISISEVYESIAGGYIRNAVKSESFTKDCPWKVNGLETIRHIYCEENDGDSTLVIVTGENVYRFDDKYIGDQHIGVSAVIDDDESVIIIKADDEKEYTITRD